MCNTQHVLRPNVDLEINHIRHFIKILFFYQGIEFISLPSIFKGKSLLFLLILKIGNHILFVLNNKLVTELDIATAIAVS